MTTPSTPPKDLRGQVLTPAMFQTGKTLGTGSFGRVRFCTLKGGRPKIDFYALKAVKKQAAIRMKQVEHLFHENEIQLALHHPFIVNLHGTFHDSKYLYMVQEYITGGEFFTHLRKAGRFENDTARFYAANITACWDYCHGKNIVYRDLKPENVLIAVDGYLKMCDFGFAKKIESRTYTLCGTPEYIAPEVLLNKGYGKGFDYWTLGILQFEMMVGFPPFVDDDPIGIYQKILTGKIIFPKFYDKDAKFLVKKLLTADVSKRYGNLKNGCDDIKNCKWYAGLNWDKLVERKIPPPYKPQVKDAMDTSQFDDYPDSDEEPPSVEQAAT